MVVASRSFLWSGASSVAQFLRLLRSGSDKFIVTSEGFLSLAIQQQLETPTLTSQRYFSSPISNQHIPAISDFIPSRRGFKIAHLNINSQTKHIDELRILLLNYSLNILKSFRNDIAQQDWTGKGSDDPNVLWADWKTKFLDVVNFHAPLRTRRARMKKVPKSTLYQYRIKERLGRSWCCQKKSYMASNDPRDWAKYNKLRNTIKKSRLLKQFLLF